MFTGSMFGTCIDLAMNNLTQVERLGSKTRTYRLAVLKPSSEQFHHVITHGSAQSPVEITYPLEAGQGPRTQRLMDIRSASAASNSHRVLQNHEPHQGVPTGSTGLPLPCPVSELPPGPRSASSEVGVPPAQLGTAQRDTRSTEAISSRDIMATRTFGVLTINPGDNPWDLGSRFLNLETVMGTNFLDYFLPIRRSPCCNHEDPESHYYLGPVVDLVKSKFYFMDAEDMRAKGGHQRPKR
jgi:palmitoyltransferase